MTPIISLPQIRGFLIVAEHLSFRRAATELKITQPALSNQIKALEQSLGVQLLTRTTRSVHLTPAGEGFLRRIRRVLADLDAIIVDVRNPIAPERGVVTIACIPTIAGHIFPRIINQYQKKHPGVTIEMVDEETVGMERKIINREVDFGVGGLPRRRDDLAFTPILADPFVLVCPRDHPLGRRKRIAIEDALKYPIISLLKGSNVRQTINAYFAQTGRIFTPTLELIHHYTIGAMVEADLGIAFLPSQAAAMVKISPRLKIVHITEAKFVRPVGMITRKDHTLPPLASDFYAFTVNAMKSTMSKVSRSVRPYVRS